jgi:hypothetical protein
VRIVNYKFKRLVKHHLFVSDADNVDWSGRCETPAGKARPGETPQKRKRRGGSRTARGKRVPGV